MASHLDAQSVEVLRTLLKHPQGLPAFGRKTSPHSGLFPARSNVAANLLSALEKQGLIAQSDDARIRITPTGGEFLAKSCDAAALIGEAAKGAENILAAIDRIADDTRRHYAMCKSVMARLNVASPPEALETGIANELKEFESSGHAHAKTLPELHAELSRRFGPISIGQLHDALRELRKNGQIVLSPWTGPLYQIPSPEFALLVGHEVLYYVHLADNGPSSRGDGGAQTSRESVPPAVRA